MSDRIALHGEVDMANIEELRLEIALRIARHEIKVVVIDCTALTYIDSAGVDVLIAARTTLSAEGRRLVIVGVVAPLVLRVFGILDVPYARPPLRGEARRMQNTTVASVNGVDGVRGGMTVPTRRQPQSVESSPDAFDVIDHLAESGDGSLPPQSPADVPSLIACSGGR